MTMDVNAVPPTTREYMLPQMPMTNAPTAETMSPRSEMYTFATRFAAYARQEKQTITGSWILRSDCRFPTEEHAE